MKYDLPDKKNLRGEKNQRLMGGLFYEFRPEAGARADRHFSAVPPSFNLTDDQQIEDTVPLKWFFMNYPTEYDFAAAVFGQWEHWQMLKDTKWFSKYYEVWSREREQMELALARKTLLDKAASGDVAAAKKIIDEAKPKRPVGRRTNQVIKEEAHAIAEEEALFEHAKRFIN